MMPLLPSAGMRTKAVAQRSSGAQSRYVTLARKRGRKIPHCKPTQGKRFGGGAALLSNVWGTLPWSFLGFFGVNGCLGAGGVQGRNLGLGTLEVAMMLGRESPFLIPRRRLQFPSG